MNRANQYYLACIIGVVAAFALILITDNGGDNNPIVGIARVVDGDTIEVGWQCDSQAVASDIGTKCDNTEYVRMIGIDAPETVDPDKPAECYGEKASEDAKGYLEGETVEVVLGAEHHDYYGRTLGYVYVNGEEYNIGALRRGDARVDLVGDNTEKAKLYFTGQTEAQRNNVGLWKAC